MCYNMGMRIGDEFKAVWLSAVFAAASLSAFAAEVAIVGGEGAWTLRRDGQPYFVRGAGGVGDLAEFAACGGNSIRTWGADRAAETLNGAAKHGVTVTIGFWLAHQNEGADYANPDWCAHVTESVLSVVRANRNHSALLMWALGNEMELGVADEDALWRYLNDLAKAVKAIDPTHPVGTVVAEVWPQKVEKMMRLAPELDWVGINSYGGARDVGSRWREMGGRRPYLLTEFGPPGPTELGLNDFGSPREWTSTAKADWYELIYRANMAADAGTWCLGSYAFIWGYKVEGTPTWFGMHLPEGDKLAAAERMQTLWGVKPLSNHVPTIQPLKLSSDVLDGTNATLVASASAADADGDGISYEWFVLPELSFLGETHGMKFPERIEGMVVAGGRTPRATVKGVGGGKFRLYCVARDGKGGAALASQAVLVKDEPLKRLVKAEQLPCAVFADGAAARWWATGFLGDAANLKIDLHCTDRPAHGKTCLRVTYAGSDWAGLMWQDPPNDWCNAAGGYNVTGARRLTFRARGAKGGERINFQVGGGRGAFPDSALAKLENVRLTRNWKRYAIDLKGLNLTCIKTGFCFSFGGQGALAFDLDDIQFE